MPKFLQQVVDHLLAHHEDEIDQVAMIVPSHRAGTFIKKYLAESAGRTIWAPGIYTMNEWLEELSGLIIPDPITLQFELYGVHRKLKGKAAEDISGFSKWAGSFLTDINEVDSYLLPGDRVFSDLRQIKEIEQWSLSAEDLTANQQQFVSFWKDLGKLYSAFREHLLGQKKAYQGAILKYLSDKIDKEQELGLSWKKVMFVGFNALSTGEDKLIRHLESIGIGETFWDADAYYLEDKNQEAGLFLRRQMEKRKEFNWVSDHLKTTSKKIEFIGVPQTTAQAKVAGAILDKLIREKGIDSEELSGNTAVVLADESLLQPVLNSLPEKAENVNVTMGYPLKEAPLFGLFEAMLDLRENALRFSSEKGTIQFYHKDLLRFFQHPYVKMAFHKGNPSVALIEEMKKRNQVFWPPESFNQVLHKYFGSQTEGLDVVFQEWKNYPDDVLHAMMKMVQTLRDLFLNREDTVLELEFLYGYAKVLNQLSELLEIYPYVSDLSTFREIFRRLCSGESLSFLGEPLQGVQVMGMLETRTLDMDNVILLSANEQILPKADKGNSLIPFDLQSLHKLPTYREKDAVFAYHFYRLIQRAKNVYLLYNTEAGTLGGGEPSRFITQIKHELQQTNPHVELRDRVVSFPVIHKEEEPLEIWKDERVLKKMDEFLSSGISPSALNVYINNPLDFYHQYILGLEEPMEVEETIEARTMGDTVHKVLEDLYKPFEGEVLHQDKVKLMVGEVRDRVFKDFSRNFPEKEVKSGKNLLVAEVSIRFIEWFLKMEQENLGQLEKDGQHLTIVKLEESLNEPFSFEIDGTKKTVRLKGLADRVDKIGDHYRIIDYKTGKVETRNLKLELMEDCFKDPQKKQCLQLLTYGMMYAQKDPSLKGKLTSGILSFRKLSQGVMNVKFNGQEVMEREILDSFYAGMNDLLNEMYDTSLPFKENSDKLY